MLSYLDVLRDKAPVGAKVAIIGCGGIGFDTAMFLSQSAWPPADIGEFCREWGIDTSLKTAGGLSAEGPQLSKSPRQIVMLQRKASKPGEGLGKPPAGSTARRCWRAGEMIPAVSYEKIDDEGLHVTIGGERQLLAVDQVVICAGQERAASWRIRCAAGKRCISSAVATWRRSWMRVGRLPGTKLALAMSPVPGRRDAPCPGYHDNPAR